MGNEYKVLTLCKEGFETDESTLEKDTDNNVIQIKDSGVNTTQLASSAVNSAKIASGAVSYGKLDANTKAFVVEHRRAGDSTQGVTAEEVVLYAYKGVTITDVGVVPDAAFGRDTSYASMEVLNYGTDGGTMSDSTLASMDFTSSNSVSKFEPKSLGTISNASVSAGEALTINITKTGGGQKLPAMLVYLVCTRAA